MGYNNPAFVDDENNRASSIKTSNIELSNKNLPSNETEVRAIFNLYSSPCVYITEMTIIFASICYT